MAWSNLSALTILVSVPVMVILLALHRYLLRGLLIGMVLEPPPQSLP